MTKVHEAIEPIKWLIGTWESMTAAGRYPTIHDFTYKEIVTFESIGQPLLNYSAKAYHPTNMNPMHFETGYLRARQGTNHLALLTAHNFGLSVIEEGSYDLDEYSIVLESRTISRMSFSKPAVVNMKRVIRLQEDGTLEIKIDMETVKTEMTNHLIAIYKKVD